jgi:hypothetical protein
LKTADQIWQKFVALPGAIIDDQVGIASQHAIGGVIGVIQKYKPRKILELGAGIGTLTYTVLETLSSFDYFKGEDCAFFTVENNEFCLQQIQNNLIGFEGRFKVISFASAIPPDIQFDLIIVDGGGDLGGDMGIVNFDNMLAKKGIILIEGNRAFQTNRIRDWYGHRSHLYIKMRTINLKTVSKNDRTVVANKPYQIFVFEPEWLEKIFLWSQSLLFNGINRLISRFVRIPNK